MTTQSLCTKLISLSEGLSGNDRFDSCPPDSWDGTLDYGERWRRSPVLQVQLLPVPYHIPLAPLEKAEMVLYAKSDAICFGVAAVQGADI